MAAGSVERRVVPLPPTDSRPPCASPTVTFDSEPLSEDAELLQRLAHRRIPDREAADDAAQEVALRFAAPSVLRGRDFDSSGDPVAGAIVWAEVSTVAFYLPWTWHATTAGQDGSHELRLDEFRDITVWAADPEDRSIRATATRMLPRGLVVDFDLYLSRSAPIRLRLVDTEGPPLANWTVRIGSPTEDEFEG